MERYNSPGDIYNNWILNSDQMNGEGTQSIQKQCEIPKRSFFSYICPCFNFNSNHSLKKRNQHSMNNTEESNSTIPFDHSKPKESITEVQAEASQELFENLNINIKTSQQSGIYIKFKQNEDEQAEKTEYDIMQQEYDRYLRQKSKPKARFFPINSLKENHLFALGTQEGKVLCKVKSYFTEPSQSSRKRQREAHKSQEKSNDPVIEKYWEKRYFLFQKFDQGIKLDQQSWFSVTPEAVAEHIATRVSGFQTVLDGFCGAGGDSIKLGLNCKRVTSNDIDQVKIKLLMNNAAVYGVDNIQAIHGDFFNLQFKRNQFEALYLSPPWGGPDYLKLEKMMPEDFIPPLQEVINKSVSLCDNVIILLPNNTDVQSLPALICKAFQRQKVVANTCSIQLEKIYFEGAFKFIILYIGNRVTKINLGDELDYIYRLLGSGEETFRYKRVIKKLREEFGMLRLLNFIFQSQKRKKALSTFYENLIVYLTENELLSIDKITKLQEMDEADASRSNQGKKQKKLEKKMIKSLMKTQLKSNQPNILTLTCNEIKINQALESPSKKEKIDQTISYVSSMSHSKMADSIINENGLKINSDKDGVRMQLVQSNIFYKMQGDV